MIKPLLVVAGAILCLVGVVVLAFMLMEEEE